MNPSGQFFCLILAISSMQLSVCKADDFEQLWEDLANGPTTTSPASGDSEDADGDFILDQEELIFGTSPITQFTYSGIEDCAYLFSIQSSSLTPGQDWDNDGVSNIAELMHGSNPRVAEYQYEVIAVIPFDEDTSNSSASDSTSPTFNPMDPEPVNPELGPMGAAPVLLVVLDHVAGAIEGAIIGAADAILYDIGYTWTSGEVLDPNELWDDVEQGMLYGALTGAISGSSGGSALGGLSLLGAPVVGAIDGLTPDGNGIEPPPNP